MALDFPSNPIDGQIYNNYYWNASVNAWSSLGSTSVPNVLRNASFSTYAASAVPLTVQGYNSQSANLQEWKDSSGVTMSKVLPTGEIVAPDLQLTKNTAHLEIGGITGTANTPYIDFHSGAAFADYDSRIIASGGTGSSGGGTLDVQAARLNLPTQTYLPGSVVQVKTVRTSARTTYAFSGDAIISDLNIPITPKFSNSLLVVQWWVNYETDYNAVFRVYRDNGLIYTSGYQGYNENDGNQWSGVAAAMYDGDVASTPNSQLIQHFVPAGSTAATTLQLSIRQDNNASSTFYLNRSVNSSGTLAYEVMVSNGICWEIAQ